MLLLAVRIAGSEVLLKVQQVRSKSSCEPLSDDHLASKLQVDRLGG